MPRRQAPSVDAYLAELPAERREAIAIVREVIRRNLPAGYAESVNWGMISYEVPLSVYSSTYNKQPLAYLALAAQKNYNAIYLMRVYGDTQQEKKLREGFKRAGKKCDMGKSCIRFKSADDLPLSTIGELVASTTPKEWIAIFEASRRK